MLDKLKQSLRRAKRGLHRPTQSGSAQAATVYSGTTIAAWQLVASSFGDSERSGLTIPTTTIDSETHGPKTFLLAPKSGTSPTEDIHHHARGGFEVLLSVLEKAADSFPPFKVLFNGLSRCIGVLEQEAKARQEYQKLLNQLNEVCKDLAGYLDSSITSSITPVTESILKISDLNTEIELLLRTLQRNKIRQYTEAMGDADEVIECYRRIHMLLGRITLNASVYTWKTIDEQTTDRRLRRLPDASAAKYKSTESQHLRRVGCAPNTRIEVLEALKAWSSDGTSEKIYWLNGMAGTGKTTIAYSFCDHLQNSYHLGASFFCSRQLPACRDVNRIIPTISSQLALYSLPFRHALSQVLERSKDAHNQPLEEQFQHLVAVPLQNIAHTFTDNVVIVIDALDECEDREGVDQILDTLISHVGGLPVKFFVSSRPEAMIMDRMRNREQEGLRSELHLHELDHTVVQDDIKTYLRIKLKPTEVSDTDFDKLAERSGVLFIYAATVVRYIEYDNFSRSTKRLRLVLNSPASHSADSDREVDKLYTTILEAAFDDDGLGDSERAEMEMILQTILCAQEPLSVDTLAELIGLESSSSVQPALRPLLSVLNVSRSNGLITTLHESFPNYMFNQARSKRFYCDMQQHNARLARLCFDRIESVNPAFNICRLESSHIFDEDVPDLDQRVEAAISNGLFYACQYWGAHLSCSGITNTNSLSTKSYEFLSLRLLMWMEIMNLKRCLYEGAAILYKIRAWCAATNQHTGCQLLTQDAYKFVATISASPLSRSTPHIYVSALQFWPKSRPISSYYRSRLTSPVKAIGEAIESRPEELILLSTVSHSFGLCIAYSSDGQYIVSNFGYSGLGVWDAQTGRMTGQLEGHEDSVVSVAYSPTGTHIASGSLDCTIRIWDARNHQPAGEPFQGHSDRVNSIAYSPDSACIVSGSDDKTVRIWDASTGQTIAQLLEGHTDGVNSVVYSPDGLHVASSSLAQGVVIWDAHTGTMVKRFFKSLDHGAKSIAYSPDGMTIASGSMNSDIRIWDVSTGRLISQPLTGHLGPVNSLDYSPDGACIVSGSHDGTIRIWGARSGQPIGQPFHGHNRGVDAVAYSPDGAHIVSSSFDETIRVWDAQPNHFSGQPHANGHLDSVNSISCSPDGARFVSSSLDKTICIWDIHTGQMIGEPMKSDVSVSSIAYSPNGEYIACGSNSPFPDSASRHYGIHFWDLRTGHVAGSPLGDHAKPITSIAYSPDGAKIISGSEDKTLRLWDVHEYRMVRQPFEGHTDIVTSVAYSPDGEYVVSGSHDLTVQVWEVSTGRAAIEPLIGHTRSVCCVAFSPDGKHVASGSSDSTIRVWDIATGEMMRQLKQEPYGTQNSLAYSPNGAYIVSGSDFISIWDAQTGQLVGSPLKGHTDLVNSVAYSSNNLYVVSGSRDKNIRIWRVGDISATRSSLEAEQTQFQVVEHSGLDWEMDEDGWVIKNESQLLVWVPFDLRPGLWRARNTAVISRMGALQLDFGEANIGQKWQRCYPIQ
ncbi:hypothetical protein FRC09_009636 [Ceratobasidium sp. 395]|nr:hypothetical protein FRC09_009636 [Ceratobasidium sp. 395]